MAPHTYTPSYSANVCCPNVAYLEHINPTPPKQKKREEKLYLYTLVQAVPNVKCAMSGFVCLDL